MLYVFFLFVPYSCENVISSDWIKYTSTSIKFILPNIHSISLWKVARAKCTFSDSKKSIGHMKTVFFFVFWLHRDLVPSALRVQDSLDSADLSSISEVLSSIIRGCFTLTYISKLPGAYWVPPNAQLSNHTPAIPCSFHASPSMLQFVPHVIFGVLRA